MRLNAYFTLMACCDHNLEYVCTISTLKCRLDEEQNALNIRISANFGNVVRGAR